MKKGRNKKNLELVKRIQAGDEEARNELLIFNMDYLKNKAKKFHDSYSNLLDEDDILQDCLIGTSLAIDKFDFDRGSKYNSFLSYAEFYMLSEVQKDLDNANIIHIPRHMHNDIRKYDSDFGVVSDEQIEKLSYAFDVPKWYVKEVLNVKNRLYDIYGNPRVNMMRKIKELPQIEIDYIRKDYECLHDVFFELLKEKLTEREYGMLSMYYGIGEWDGVPHTLDQVGDCYHVHRERVRQILAKAIRKLRRYKDTRDITRGLLDTLNDMYDASGET